eukprot:2443116-Rhodomonas_salina.3
MSTSLHWQATALVGGVERGVRGQELGAAAAEQARAVRAELARRECLRLRRHFRLGRRASSVRNVVCQQAGDGLQLLRRPGLGSDHVEA